MCVDPRLRAALIRQHEQRARILGDGARHVGWKMGMGESERIGGPVIGYLTTATELRAGARYQGSTHGLHVDAEIAIEIGNNNDVRGYAAALELVDLSDHEDAGRIVARNIFHRAFALGETRMAELPVRVQLLLNGAVRAENQSDESLEDRLARAQCLLACVDEHVRPGDRIITGSIIQVPVARGDAVAADFGSLGSIELCIA